MLEITLVASAFFRHTAFLHFFFYVSRAVFCKQLDIYIPVRNKYTTTGLRNFLNPLRIKRRHTQKFCGGQSAFYPVGFPAHHDHVPWHISAAPQKTYSTFLIPNFFGPSIIPPGMVWPIYEAGWRCMPWPQKREMK